MQSEILCMTVATAVKAYRAVELEGLDRVRRSLKSR